MIDKDFRAYLVSAVREKCYVKIQYFTDIHEFMSVMTVVKEFITRDDKEFLRTASGELIPFEDIVRINDRVAPQYQYIMDFTCDC